MHHADRIVEAAQQSVRALEALSFGQPVHTVYNPLRYAFEPWRRYVAVCAAAPRRVVFLGMNPGPWGMVQTGVPFGEVAAVAGWIGIRGRVDRPESEHPKRPILGFDCPRSEVSGRRLWGLFRERFGTPDRFFREHAVMNYCPLAFLEESGRNLTPDKLRAAEREPLTRICDRFLAVRLAALQPEIAIAVGGYAETALKRVIQAPDFTAERANLGVEETPLPRVVRILHPSPASPRANAGWAQAVTEQLAEAGVWPPDSASRPT